MDYFGGETRILRDLEESVGRELRRLGILSRLFARVKSNESMKSKRQRKNYDGSHRMRDFFGIRIALYFDDDTDVVAEALERLFPRVEATIDAPGTEVFGPKRHNLVLKLPEWASRECRLDWEAELIDRTLEVQIRTVLSEGWHEIEHDLRYKAREEWAEHEDLSRALNGILATIETCDWGFLQIFDELTRRHYEQKRWNAMLRAKYRLRLANSTLSSEVLDLLSRSPQLQDSFYRFSRGDLLRAMLRRGADFPLTLDNLCFAANRLCGFNHGLRKLEPESFEALMVRCEFGDLPRES